MSFKCGTLSRIQERRQIWAAWETECLDTLGCLEPGDLIVQSVFVRSSGNFEIVGCLTKFGFGYLFLTNREN